LVLLAPYLTKIKTQHLTEYSAGYLEQEAFFKSLDINITEPGFYDDPNFISVERHNVSILKNYAKFVRSRDYDNEYLAESERKIKIITSILHGELVRDGRLGACIDMTAVLSRILDLEGIWNYPQSGSMTITFPPEKKMPSRHFWTIEDGPFVAAHAWLSAPPFKIIDLTLKQQPYRHNETAFLPDMILQKDTSNEKIELLDLVETNILRQMYLIHRNKSLPILKRIDKNLPTFTKTFKPDVFSIDGIKFKYTPIGISFSELPLEKTTSLKLNGRYGQEIYNTLIKPNL
jgi:hypothetical protein